MENVGAGLPLRASRSARVNATFHVPAIVAKSVEEILS